jgi:putative transposase
MTVSYVARKYAISPRLLFRWRKLMAEGGKQAVKADDEVVAAAEVRELKKRIRELERVLGGKTLENEILKESVAIAHEKTDLVVAVLARRGFPVKAVAETLKVSRSNLAIRQNGGGKERKAYGKADDAVLLPAVRAIVDERPTYGYRRVGALLNRARRSQGLPIVNFRPIGATAFSG